MQKMKMIAGLVAIGSLLVSACGAEEPSPTPTVDVVLVRTEAVQTFAADLTATAFAKPTETPTPTLSPTPFPTVAALGTPLGTQSSLTGATTSCNGLVYVRDVTIPDNTPMTPGQTFTKTWEVKNTGTCAWDAGFKFALIGGDAMAGQALTLAQAVAVGASTQISIPMTAPTNKTGVIQGTWRMSNAQGVFFGEAVTVVIVIGGASSSASSASSSSASSSSASSSSASSSSSSP